MADTHRLSARNHRLQWLYVIVCLVGLYGIVPQLGDFRHGFTLWRHIDWFYLVALFLSCCLTYVMASATYTLLAFRRLRYGRTVLVEVAGMFVNRLLPAGVGGMGANYAYLRKSKLSTSEASATVAANSMLGLIGHLLLVVTIILIRPRLLHGIHGPHVTRLEIVLGVALFVLILLCLRFVRGLSKRVSQSLRNFAQQLARYKMRKGHLALALVSSICLTLANVSGLWFSALALGIHLSFLVILVVFTIGIGVGSVTPTPGGIGGLEAGMVAGLVAYHQSAATALAVVLLYRLVSYWLALFIGAVMFIIVKRKHYF